MSKSKKKGRKTQIFRPISWLPMIAEALDGMAADLIEEIATYEEALSKPHLLDDGVMNRAIRAMKETVENSSLYANQLVRWLSLDLAPDLRCEVERLVEVNERIRAGTERAIHLCEKIKEGTIDRILEKDDFELGFEVLTGKRPWPSPNPVDNVIAGLQPSWLPTPLERFEAALEIHGFVESILAAGGGEEQILAHPDMLSFMMRFRGIMDGAESWELEELTQRLSGFRYLARMLDNLAEAIQTGRIKVR